MTARTQRKGTTSDAGFTAACRAEFDFLVTVHGFRRAVSVQPAEAWVSFSRVADDACVSIFSERGGEPWVVITLGGRQTGLHRHVARLAPSLRKRWPAPTDVAGQVAASARFLEAHFDEVLGQPREPARSATAPKARARPGAGALTFLETELGWDWGRLTNQNGPGTVEVVFVKGPLRLRICVDHGKLDAVFLHARTQSVNLDEAIAQLAANLACPRGADAKQRLLAYAAFLRGPGAGLLAGKPSAWSRLRSRGR